MSDKTDKIKRKKKKKKIIKYRKPLSVNIGFIVFFAIFAYILIYMAMYFTRDRVSIYEVVYGKNADQTNKTYQALLLRTENQVISDTAGYLNYYVRSGERTSVGTTIYTIDESGKIQEYLATNESGTEMSDSDYETLRSYITNFTTSYSDIAYSETYNFKIDLSSALLECVNMNMLNQKISELSADGGYNYSVNKAANSGIVEYYSDGYENKPISEITAADFDYSNYNRNHISSGNLIESGAPAYKIITEENWNVLIPLTPEEADSRQADTRIKIKFTEDGTTVVGDFQVVTQNDCTFGLVSLNKYMLKYASERYAEIQIVETEVSGLKIPKTSVVTKDFFTIPKDFSMVGGEDNETGFSKQVYDETTGTTTVKFISPEIFYENEQYYYVDDEELAKGDILIKNDSVETFTVGQTDSLEGVYNVNSGYCIFRRIEKLSESSDYFLINTSTSYGLKVYDHIVIDGSVVTENAVVFR